jgi:hypothetical protein
MSVVDIFRRILGNAPAVVRGTQEYVIDLEQAPVPMKRVYLLSEELRRVRSKSSWLGSSL